MTESIKIQFSRFLIIGVLTLLFYSITLFFLVSIMNFQTGLSAVGAYLVAMGINYFGHYFWTYQTDRPHWSATKRYLLVNLAFLVLNAGVMAFGPTLLDIHYGVLQVALVVVIAMTTFLLQRAWIFRRRS